ncbi:MAG: S-layer homology domain-containing protein [Patescibacteria group bacterium]|nr:S-layer homology domain-containing protein [Patescibacteria group bacterium]
MRSKLVVIILFFAVILVPPFAYAESAKINIIDVLDDHWANGYVRYLVQQGFMGVSAKGEFSPDKSVTRGEMVQIILRQIDVKLIAPDKPTFADVSVDYPLYKEIETAYQLGVVKGVDNDDGTRSFHPDAFVTRAQFVKIILQANQIAVPIAIATADFPDIAVVNWTAPYVHVARQMGFIKGYADGRFGPDENITRAQLAKILYLFLAASDRIVEDTIVTSSQTVVETQDDASAYVDLVLSLINASRHDFDKPPLILDADLSDVAQQHAQWLVSNNIKSSHTGEGGSSPFDRLRSAQINYAAAAENVGWSSANVRDVASALLAIHSDPINGMMAESDAEVNHRTNILGTFHNFNRIGIGITVNEQSGSREVRVVEIFVESN